MNHSYRTAAELLALAEKTSLSIAQIAIESEIEGGNRSRDEIIERMNDYYRRMKSSVAQGLEITQRSQSRLSGGDARRVLAHSQRRKPSVLGAMFERSLAYGLAVMETNAAFGQIVATPTAGSAGIAPACLLSWQETRGASDEDDRAGFMDGGGRGQNYWAWRLFFGRAGRLSGRNRVGVQHGRRRDLRTRWRHAQRRFCTRRRLRSKTPRINLRSDWRLRRGALHQTQRTLHSPRVWRGDAGFERRGKRGAFR